MAVEEIYPAQKNGIYIQSASGGEDVLLHGPTDGIFGIFGLNVFE